MPTYKNGNYFVSFGVNSSGMRYQKRLMREEDTRLGIKPVPEYPELVDIKVTNKCSVGCKYCYQDSKDEIDTPKRNFEFTKAMVKQLPPFSELAIGGGDVLEYEYLDELITITRSFYSVNFTINAISIINTKSDIHIMRLHKCFDYANAIGVSVSNINQIKKVQERLNDLNIPTNKICWHIIPDLFKDITSLQELFELILSTSRSKASVLLLGYKEFGRGKLYTRHQTHPETALNELVRDYSSKLYIKVDTKFTYDYNMSMDISEGEFSMNIDAPNKTVSPSSWRNKEQFLDDDASVTKAFASIRSNMGFEPYIK